MMQKKSLLIKALIILAITAGAVFFFSDKEREVTTGGYENTIDTPDSGALPEAAPRKKAAEAANPEAGRKTIVIPYEETEDPAIAEAEAAQKEAEREQEAILEAVREWEALTDEVVSKESKEPIPDRAKRVKEGLKKVPESERDVALQSMLNLVEDEEFAILDPILFDKTEPKEVVEAIFDDMLNRPEDLKLGYLVKIAQDREHPMFADAMHILTVTIDMPETEEETN